MTDPQQLPVPAGLKPLTGKVREKARHLYYGGFFVTEIVETLDIDINELGLAVFGADGTGLSEDTWAYKKLHRPVASVVSYEKVKTLALRKPEAKLVQGITRRLEKMEDNNSFEDMDMDDLSKAVSMVEKLDRIGRLEEGKATQHIAQERRTFSLREIAEGEGEQETEIRRRRTEGHHGAPRAAGAGKRKSEKVQILSEKVQ